jgi:hypothetical protein
MDFSGFSLTLTQAPAAGYAECHELAHNLLSFTDSSVRRLAFDKSGIRIELVWGTYFDVQGFDPE